LKKFLSIFLGLIIQFKKILIVNISTYWDANIIFSSKMIIL
jgi:hypothetical protein